MICSILWFGQLISLVKFKDAPCIGWAFILNGFNLHLWVPFLSSLKGSLQEITLGFGLITRIRYYSSDGIHTLPLTFKTVAIRVTILDFTFYRFLFTTTAYFFPSSSNFWEKKQPSIRAKKQECTTKQIP